MIKIPSFLHHEALCDVQRPHPFAYERVGFYFGRPAEMPDGITAIMVQRYLPIPDDLYVRDPTVGAAISGAAIRLAMAESMSTGCSVVHVHMHDFEGPVFFSQTDLQGNHATLRSLRNGNSRVPHGALVFGPGGAIAVTLRPGEREHRPSPVTIVGYPVRLWSRSP